MKKLLLLLIIISLLLTMVSCKEDPVTVAVEDTFAIYLASNDSIREYGYYDTENLQISGEPIITGEDVRQYFWDQHVIELNGSFMEKLFYENAEGYESFEINIKGLRQYDSGGSRLLTASQNMCFIVVVNGRKIYSGTFPSGPLLPETDEQLVIGDIGEDKLALVFSGMDYDVRNNDSVYEYFLNNSKIGQMTGTESNEMVAELQEKLAETEKQYLDLQTMYEELLQSSDEAYNDYKDATINWLENRLDLYMLETQEGSAYERFTNGLLGLDLSDTDSVGDAWELFEYNAVASTEKNDRMFNALEELYYVVIDSIPIYNTIDEIDEEFIKKAEENWITVKTSGSKITAYPITGKLRENLGIYLSPQLNEYLLIKDFESTILNAAEADDVIWDNDLVVSVDDIGHLIYMWKNFSVEFPYSYPFNFKARARSEYLMDIYLGKTELSESPLYFEDTLVLKDEAKASYERFIVEYIDSPYYEIILEIYRLLKENEFIFTQKVDEYISNLDYDNY